MGNAKIQLQADPNDIEVEVARTAVIVVDMQNDFGTKGGIFDHAGVDISGIRKAVVPTRRALDAARNSGIKIVYLKMGFKPDLSDLGAEYSVNRTRHVYFGVGQECVAPDGRNGRFLIRDTWNTDIVSELTPQPDDLVVYKHRFSGFFETELDNILRGLGIRNLIFTGCTTSICVDSTIRDARFRDYLCVLLADCSAEPIGVDLERTNHEASLLTVKTLLGWVSDSERFVAALKSSSSAARQSVS